MDIPKFTPVMLRSQPDQFCEILNRIVFKANEIDKKFESVEKQLIPINKSIASLQKDVDDLMSRPWPEPPEPPTPPSPSEYVQVRSFNPAHMGTQQGWCLKNCRLGYDIPNGHYYSARDDMNAQINNGTFHDGDPPSDVAVPIYYNNSSKYGHIAVSDHGVIWSDGTQYPSINAVSAGYAGWGELCDSVRVVRKNS